MTATAVAQTSTMPSSTPLTQSLGVEDIWKNPQIAGPTLSRSGKYLAATAPNRGRMNLLVLDMETRKSDLLTSFDDFDVINVSWLGDDRLMFSLGQNNSPTGPGQFDSGGLFVVNRDGTNFRRLGASGAGGGRERRVHAGHFYRKDVDVAWSEIARYSRDKGAVFAPLAFESDDQTLQMATNKDRDTMAVYRYNPNEKSSAK